MQALHDIALPKIEEEKPEEPVDEAFEKDDIDGPPLPQCVFKTMPYFVYTCHNINWILNII